MEVNLLYRHDMSKSLESDWIPVRIQKESNLGRRRLARSLMVDWDNYDGAVASRLIVYATNNPRAKVIGRQVDINTVTNKDDAYLQYIDGRYAYLKVEYISEGNPQNGIISATAYYD